MSSPEVTIILRATRRDSLPRAIDSALRQTFTDHEVLVVDDACDLADVVGAFPDRRVRYHRNAERLGEAASLRTGVELARGALVSSLDDDDLLLPTFLERAVEQFHADPSLGVVFSNQYYEQHGRLWPRETGLEGGRHDRILPALVRNYPIGASVNVIRRHVWLDGERVLPVSPNAPSDIVYGIRTAMAGWPFYYIDEPLGIYRLHEGQMSARLDARERGVNLWSGFRFPDSELEWIRLGRVAEGHIACAALNLQSDELPAARRHLAQARVVQPSAERVRRLALSAIASHPALPRIARRVWKLYRRLRPYRPAPFGLQEPSSVRLLEDVL